MRSIAGMGRSAISRSTGILRCCCRCYCHGGISLSKRSGHRCSRRHHTIGRWCRSSLLLGMHFFCYLKMDSYEQQ